MPWLVLVVVGIKDTEFWKQFTTRNSHPIKCYMVVVGIKDTEFWKQFTTLQCKGLWIFWLLLVSKILNSESNSQPIYSTRINTLCCCWYQRYWILKAIHNSSLNIFLLALVVVGIKDTEFWKQFTTISCPSHYLVKLLLVSKILNSESNSQLLCSC